MSDTAVRGIVLAAGGGRRFGDVKQLAVFRGRPLVEWALMAMRDARSVSDRALVLGADAVRILDAIDLCGAVPVVVDRWQAGMGATLRDAVRTLGADRPTVITLGDQPLIGAHAIDRVCTGHDSRDDASRATYAGRPGHPVLLGPRALRATADLDGDVGARALLAAFGVGEIACDGLADPTDIDTPADLRRLLAAAGGRGSSIC